MINFLDAARFELLWASFPYEPVFNRQILLTSLLQFLFVLKVKASTYLFAFVDGHPDLRLVLMVIIFVNLMDQLFSRVFSLRSAWASVPWHSRVHCETWPILLGRGLRFIVNVLYDLWGANFPAQSQVVSLSDRLQLEEMLIVLKAVSWCFRHFDFWSDLFQILSAIVSSHGVFRLSFKVQNRSSLRHIMYI